MQTHPDLVLTWHSVLICYPHTCRYSVPPIPNHGPFPALGLFPFASLYLYNWSPVLLLVRPAQVLLKSQVKHVLYDALLDAESGLALLSPRGTSVSSTSPWGKQSRPGYKQTGTWCKYRSITKEEKPWGNARMHARPGFREMGHGSGNRATLRTRGGSHNSLPCHPQKEDYVKPFSPAPTLLYQLLFPLSTAWLFLYIELKLCGREDIIRAIRHHDLHWGVLL